MANKHNHSDKTQQGKNLQEYMCQTCQHLVHDNDKAVACDCDISKWYHIECINITDQQYDLMKEGTTTDPVWLCDNCKQWINNEAIDISMMLNTTVDSNKAVSNRFCRGNNAKAKRQDNHYEVIIEMLRNDMDDLKEEIKLLKKDRERLSDTLARKTDTIYRLEDIILEFTQGIHPESNCPVRRKTEDITKRLVDELEPSMMHTNHRGPPGGDRPIQSTGAAQGRTEESAGELVNGIHQNMTQTGHSGPLVNDKHIQSSNTSQTDAETESDHPLIIGDSLLRGVDEILRSQGVSNAAVEVIPGGKIQDMSRFLKNRTHLPSKVVINIGTNNLAKAKTPNHVMRPLWMTIEANQKRFPRTNWYICSIPLREDCKRLSIFGRD
ncbi:uncharacterized protein LOC120351343 [Nilaparvata lugens]|uniref:uncharacterized protein LOC120351343 n=1 Tax=Nilaparvata lugens TaxID=108931 RepID=UPI00193DCB24|nr:uncharacterized protein LOC120351343 [Nilaparvata lugens]XP_039284210.1 uncharacterized protein LOC120351343 [Nilaparvata lugens]XP_039284211.1 uncharacterized protein LOC120351343 [Nilaparvata lugens]